MLKTLAVTLLAVAPFSLSAQTAQYRADLTVSKVFANVSSNPSYGVEFLGGNPVSGEDCPIQYRYDHGDIAIVNLINRSNQNQERMLFILEDDNPEGRTPCSVKSISTLD